MAEDEPGRDDDLPDDDSDDLDDDGPTRVARERYVRSGWGVLCALGIIAGIVIVAGGFADFDTDPFCARAAEEAERMSSAVVGDPVGGGSDAAAPDPLDEATRRLALYREYRDLVPYDLEGTLDTLVDAEQRLVDDLEALGPDADRDAMLEVEAQHAQEDIEEVPEARFDVDLYAADVCEGVLPQLVD